MLHRALLTFIKHLDLSMETSNLLTFCLVQTLRLALQTIVCHSSPKSDIYAFGVLLLELLSGKPPLQHSILVTSNLQTYVQSAREDEGVDSDRISMIIDIAAACVRSSPESRPAAWQVLKMIQEVKEADTTGDNDNDIDLTSNS